MKHFKYNFSYRGKQYSGNLESQLYLDTFGGEAEKTLMRLLSNKYGFDSDFANSSRSKLGVMVSQIKVSNIENTSNIENIEETNSQSFSRKEGLARAKKEANNRDRELDSFLSKNRTVQKSPEQILAERQIEVERIADKKKSDQEFFQNMKKYWFIWIPLVIAFVIWFNVSTGNKRDAKEEAVRLNQQLEQVEDKVKVAIQNNEKDKALELTNKLVHPSHILYEGKGELFSDEYYDIYWNKKREEYKKLIFQESSSNNVKKDVKKSVVKENVDDAEVLDREKRESDSLNDAENIPAEYRN